MEVKYQSEAHREIVLGLLDKFDKKYKAIDMVDIEYFCAYYILTLESVRVESEKYLNQELIDFDGLVYEFEEEDPRRYTIKLAWDLFNALGELNLMDLISKIDFSEWEYLLQAIDYRKKGVSLKAI